MNRDRLWQQIQLCFDARQDPLDDETVQEGLLAHPEVLEELAELRTRLITLPAPAPRRRRRAAAAAVLVLLGAGAGSYLLRPQPLPVPDLRQDLRVLELRIGSSYAEGDASESIAIEQGLLHVTETRTRRQSTADPDVHVETEAVQSRARPEIPAHQP